jgi:hypothetical protein
MVDIKQNSLSDSGRSVDKVVYDEGGKLIYFL